MTKAEFVAWMPFLLTPEQAKTRWIKRTCSRCLRDLLLTPAEARRQRVARVPVVCGSCSLRRGLPGDDGNAELPMEFVLGVEHRRRLIECKGPNSGAAPSVDSA